VEGRIGVPFHDDCFKGLLATLEAAIPTAREEFELLHSGFANETAGLATGGGGSWTQFLLLKNGAPVPGCKRAPATCETLLALPLAAVCDGQAKFSVLRAGTRIRAHAGPSADRLRVHCTIKLFRAGVHAATFRVGTETRHWRDGECFVFDESIEHEVVTHAAVDDERVVLLIDIVNPFLAKDGDWENAVTPDARARAADALDKFREETSRCPVAVSVQPI
jgi:aspartyl/asparaginyl beta-hydroxylase (cupin superfamily)